MSETPISPLRAQSRVADTLPVCGMATTKLVMALRLAVVTLKRLEAAGTEIRGSAQTMVRIQRALESAGIIFIDQDAQAGPGVRLRRPISP